MQPCEPPRTAAREEVSPEQLLSLMAWRYFLLLDEPLCRPSSPSAAAALKPSGRSCHPFSLVFVSSALLSSLLPPYTSHSSPTASATTHTHASPSPGSVIITIGSDVPKKRDREHIWTSVRRLQIMMTF
ncbi:hypothetical protein CLOM_g6021 [Closterium sp. NIES-68]|nr:hypothetical protein CLOM_g6021 [Closterium sp. NIES-68]